MAKRGRDDEVPPLPPPSFTALSGIVHVTIASFLPDGDSKKDSRLRVSEVSRAPLELYGGSLTSATVRDVKDGLAARLAALLRWQSKLEKISVTTQGPILALSQAMAQGCCRAVESLLLNSGGYEARPLSRKHLDLLAGALEADGALPALEKLELSFRSTPHVLARLAEALVGGALPLLEHLELYQKNFTDRDLAADMVERRAQISGCHGLTCFSANRKWLGGGTPAEIRLLRATTVVKSLSGVRWHADFDPCFRDICPPHLELLGVHIDHEAFPSLEVLEAAPALKRIGISGDDADDEIGAAAFQSVIAALHRGVGLNLQDIDLSSCMISDVHFSDFLDALKSSGCAAQMVRLSFFKCGIGVNGACALASLLRADGLPALEILVLGLNQNIEDKPWPVVCAKRRVAC